MGWSPCHLPVGEAGKNHQVASGPGVTDQDLLLPGIHLIGAKSPDLPVSGQAVRGGLVQISHVIVDI